MTSYTKESNDLKRSVIQTKCKETQEETNEFMGWASQISKLNENTAFNLYTLTVKDRPQAVDDNADYLKMLTNYLYLRSAREKCLDCLPFSQIKNYKPEKTAVCRWWMLPLVTPRGY